MPLRPPGAEQEDGTIAADDGTPLVLLCCTGSARARATCDLLADANCQVDVFPIEDSPVPTELQERVDLFLVEGASAESRQLLAFCETLDRIKQQRFVPLIFLTDDAGPVMRALSHGLGANAHLVKPVRQFELLAQVHSLLRIKELQDRLVDQNRELDTAHRQLQYAFKQIDSEIELASKIQISLLPHQLPTIPGYHFAVKSVASNRVSGDFHDITILPDGQVAWYVADAMGHGVPAGLITIFLKRGVAMTDFRDGAVAIVPPEEVLVSLNRDLIAQELPGSCFVTMFYATLQPSDGTFRCARAGHPLPILLRADGSTERPEPDGTLLGIMESDFDPADGQLRPGDRLLVFTDGVDAVRFEGHRQGEASFLACVEANRDRPIEELIAHVYETLFPDRRHQDDLTLFGVERKASSN